MYNNKNYSSFSFRKLYSCISICVIKQTEFIFASVCTVRGQITSSMRKTEKGNKRQIQKYSFFKNLCIKQIVRGPVIASDFVVIYLEQYLHNNAKLLTNHAGHFSLVFSQYVGSNFPVDFL